MLKKQSRSAFTSNARAAHSGRVKSGAGVMGSSGSSRSSGKSGSGKSDANGGIHNDTPRTSSRIFRDGAHPGGRS